MKTKEGRGSPAFPGEINYARMLISRLERLSVDSYWAHRSSGLRGSLLREMERLEESIHRGHREDIDGGLRHLQELIDQGADLLEKAAREIRGDERIVK